MLLGLASEMNLPTRKLFEHQMFQVVKMAREVILASCPTFVQTAKK